MEDRWKRYTFITARNAAAAAAKTRAACVTSCPRAAYEGVPSTKSNFWQCTTMEVCKGSLKGTFAATRGDDKNAPKPDDHSWGERIAALRP
jgi:hypothetical protein